MVQELVSVAGFSSHFPPIVALTLVKPVALRWLGQACGELLADRAGLGKQGSDGNCAPGEKHVRLQGHRLLAGSGEAVLVAGRETIIDAEVRPLGAAEALHGGTSWIARGRREAAGIPA